MGDVDPRAAFECAHSTEYFTELIESGHDPLWTYRYIQYRLNGVYKDILEEFGSFNYLTCTRHVYQWLEKNLPEDEDRDF